MVGGPGADLGVLVGGIVATMAALEGSAFDKAYVDNEVAYHKTVDGALETTLIPDASNGELKSLLQTGLKIF
jgi:putative membrane protein